MTAPWCDIAGRPCTVGPIGCACEVRAENERLKARGIVLDPTQAKASTEAAHKAASDA